MGFGVNSGKDIALDTLTLAHDGVKRQALQGLELNAFGLSGGRGSREAFALSLGIDVPGTATQFSWRTGNHSPNRAYTRQREAKPLAIRDKFGKYLFFTEVRISLSQTFEFSHDLWAPNSSSDASRAFADRLKRYSIAASLLQTLAPCIQRAFAHAKGINC